MPPTLAARWTTTSAPSTAARVCVGSRRSWSADRTIRASTPRSPSRAVTARPRNPAPPVTTTALPRQNSGAGSDTAVSHPHAAPGELVLKRLEIGVAHDLDEL